MALFWYAAGTMTNKAGHVVTSQQLLGRPASVVHDGPVARYVTRSFALAFGAQFEKSKRPPDLVKIEARQLWVPIYFHKDWMAAARMVAQASQPVVGEIRIFPREDTPFQEIGVWSGEVFGLSAKAPFGGITKRLLIKLKLGALGQCMGQLANVAAQLTGEDWPPYIKAMRSLFPKRSATKTKKRERKPDIVFAQLAAEYTGLANADSKRPVAEIAKRLKTDTPKVRDMLHEARKRGLLTVRGHGVPGGQLTPRAIAVLQLQGRSAVARGKEDKPKIIKRRRKQ